MNTEKTSTQAVSLAIARENKEQICPSLRYTDILF